MLIKISTIDGGHVWVNPNYITDIQEFALAQGPCRIVYVSHGGERPGRVHTYDPMDAIAFRVNTHVERTHPPT